MPPAPVPQHDFLLEPLLTVRTTAGARRESLPAVLELLGNDQIDGFPGLQAHQQHAWHAFLVQLAAIALHRNHKEDSSQSGKTWGKWLLALVGGAPEAWCLVVPDLKMPALFQPPISAGSLEKWKGPRSSPDDIDILLTAKNHDVKCSRLLRPTPEHWFFALLNLQTMQGFLGAGNYGIARMNGGFSSRPGVGLMDGLRLGKRFAQDVSGLLKGRDKLLETYAYSREDGLALLWTEPWNGKSSFPSDKLDPYFVEVCRRIRLSRDDGGNIEAWTTSTEKPRVNIEFGLTGDPWTPVGDEAALTVSAKGFGYDLVSKLLFRGGYRLPAAADFKVHRNDPHVHLTVLVRGQGKTEGLHQRLIPVSDRQLDLGNEEHVIKLGEVSEERIELTEKFRNKVLKPPLLVLIQGAPAKLDFKDGRADRWLKALDREVDRIFFTELFDEWRLPPEEREHKWRLRLARLGHQQLLDAIRSAPVADSHRLRAESAAEGQFIALLKKHEFPFRNSKEAPDDLAPAV